MLLDPSNATTPVGWYSEPSYRGTYSLLSSCVSTLLICVLSAVHLDVPAEHHSRLHKWVKKAKWVAVGVFAPEWLTMTAYLEWQNARGLVLEANSRLTFVDPVRSLPTFRTSLFRPFSYVLTSRWRFVQTECGEEQGRNKKSLQASPTSNKAL